MARHNAVLVTGLCMAVLGLSWGTAAVMDRTFLLPSAPSAGNLRATAAAAADAAAERAVPQASLGAAPVAIVAAAALALSLGLAARRPSTPLPLHRREARIVATFAQGNERAIIEDDESDEEEEEDEDLFEEDEDDELYDEEDEALEEAVCNSRFQEGSHHKFEKVLWQIRGRTYRDALMMLEFVPWKRAKEVLKAIKHAAANAQNTKNMDKSRLYISKCYAMPGPFYKRQKRVSKGQFHQYQVRLSHLHIRVAEMTDEQMAKMEMS